MNTEARYYGVSSGDGNNGVSHMYPDYIVKTNEPFRLAELAAISSYKPEYQQWALRNVTVDGEGDYTVYATFHESYETQQERDAMQARLDNMREDDPDREALEQEIEHYGCDYAELCFEVFPWEGELPANKPVFESLEDAYTVNDLRLVP